MQLAWPHVRLLRMLLLVAQWLLVRPGLLLPCGGAMMGPLLGAYGDGSPPGCGVAEAIGQGL